MAPAEPHLEKRPERSDIRRFAVLLGAVVLIIAVLGLVGLPDRGDSREIPVRMLLTVLAAGVLLATLRVARMTREHRRWMGTLAGGLLVVALIGVAVTSSSILTTLVAVLWVLLVASAPVLVLRQVLTAQQVDAQTILGALTVYLLLGVSLAFVAIAMQASVGFFPSPPRSTAYIYFGFVTITTLGYGDLTPYTDAARMVSVLYAVVAQMYLVVVVARLVAIWKPQSPSTTRGEHGGGGG